MGLQNAYQVAQAFSRRATRALHLPSEKYDLRGDEGCQPGTVAVYNVQWDRLIGSWNVEADARALQPPPQPGEERCSGGVRFTSTRGEFSRTVPIKSPTAKQKNLQPHTSKLVIMVW